MIKYFYWLYTNNGDGLEEPRIQHGNHYENSIELNAGPFDTEEEAEAALEEYYAEVKKYYRYPGYDYICEEEYVLVKKYSAE